MDEYFVVGKSLPHTLSPQIHREFGCRYGVKELGEDDLAAFINARRFRGINVTVPYKETVIPLLDDVDLTAASIGAVNTVVNAGGELLGFNTDADGMEYALKRAGIDVAGKKTAVLGSGGTSKTARRVLERGGAAEIKIISRNGALNYGNCYTEAGGAEVIINTTPVGTFPNVVEAPLIPSKFPNLEGVFDVVYNPVRTRLIYEAEKCGAVVSNGLAMLVEQARLAHNLFESYARCGGIVPLEITPSVCEKIKNAQINIVLVGMSGSGKSAVGKLLAQELGREFVDTDSKIEELAGKSAETIFAEDGEAEFRALERRIVGEYCGLKNGLVIATGGGAVLDEENRFFIKCNSVVVLILRDVGKLATLGRPLTKTRADAERIYEERKEIYFAAADFAAENNGTVNGTVSKILERLRFGFKI